MRIKVTIYSLTDAQGNTTFSIVDDPSNRICIGGIDAEGRYRQFDSTESYWIYEWVELHKGFSVKTAMTEIDTSLLNWS